MSLHPNVVPTGANATIDIRVPNEEAKATTNQVAVQFPAGFLDVVTGFLPGWTAEVKTEKLATPVKTADGTVNEQVSEVVWKANAASDGIPTGSFLNFPILVLVPGKAGDVLTFKTVQTYSNGKVTRWIGPPSSEEPAPTLDVTAEGGVLQDVAGSEAGPPAPTALPATSSATVKATKATVVNKTTGASKGLAITALIVGLLGLALGGVALARSRRRPGAAA